MVITFDIRPEDDIEGNTDIWVDVQTPPVIPLCEFLNHNVLHYDQLARNEFEDDDVLHYDYDD